MVDAHGAAGGPDAAEFLGERDRTLAEAIQLVLRGHDGFLLAVLLASTHTARMNRLAPTSEGLNPSLLLGDTTL